jgi:formiminotetrahydrofolate cyclodeaminase
MGRLTDLTVGEFGAGVAAASPAPGGGSAAALAGSVAAALVAMVCRLSGGRDDLATTADELAKTLDTAEELRSRLLELIDEDTAAFDAVMIAVRLPKAEEAQRVARVAALEQATLAAAAVPLETLTAAARTLALAGALVGRANPAAASDLGVAVELALAAAEGALLNVAINLSALPPGGDVDRLRHASAREIDAARATATLATEAIRRGLSLG